MMVMHFRVARISFKAHQPGALHLSDSESPTKGRNLLIQPAAGSEKRCPTDEHASVVSHLQASDRFERHLMEFPGFWWLESRKLSVVAASRRRANEMRNRNYRSDGRGWDRSIRMISKFACLSFHD